MTHDDNDDPATRSSRKDDELLDADERGLLGNALLSVQEKMEKGLEHVSKTRTFNRLRKRIADNDQFERNLQVALEDAEWKKLYKRYGNSFIKVLTRKYGVERMARVLDADFANPERFAEPGTTVANLVMDQLTLWKEQRKTLANVFDELKLGVEVQGEGLYRNLASRRLKLLAAYSKFVNDERSAAAFLELVMTRFGGKKEFYKSFYKAKRIYDLAKKMSVLDDAILKTCLKEKLTPANAFKKIGLDLQTPNLFRSSFLRKMEQYVRDFNENVSSHRRTTVLKELKVMLGGESALLKVLTADHINEATKTNMLSYEKQLFEQWKIDKVNPLEGFRQRLHKPLTLVEIDAISNKYAEFNGILT